MQGLVGVGPFVAGPLNFEHRALCELDGSCRPESLS
uniref:Uncharacterized protein n=1 Tax=Anguilla anguilla TaxID=7936 RepID=A0A0E9XSJ1_ANGAN